MAVLLALLEMVYLYLKKLAAVNKCSSVVLQSFIFSILLLSQNRNETDVSTMSVLLAWTQILHVTSSLQQKSWLRHVCSARLSLHGLSIYQKTSPHVLCPSVALLRFYLF